MERIASLRGGQKNMWLRHHRSMVLDFYAEFGEEPTKQQFCLTHDTLERFVQFEHKPYQRPFTKVDQALLKAEIAEEGARQLSKEVIELKEQFAKFQETVSKQMVEKFFIPLLQSTIHVDETLGAKPKQDNLSLEGVNHEGIHSVKR